MPPLPGGWKAGTSAASGAIFCSLGPFLLQRVLRAPGPGAAALRLRRSGPAGQGPRRGSGLRPPAAPGPGARKTKGERRKGQAPLGINLGQRATIFAGLYANASEPRRQCIGGAGTGPRL